MPAAVDLLHQNLRRWFDVATNQALFCWSLLKNWVAKTIEIELLLNSKGLAFQLCKYYNNEAKMLETPPRLAVAILRSDWLHSLNRVRSNQMQLSMLRSQCFFCNSATPKPLVPRLGEKMRITSTQACKWSHRLVTHWSMFERNMVLTHSSLMRAESNYLNFIANIFLTSSEPLLHNVECD